MTIKPEEIKPTWLLAPVFGTIVFVGLYIVATILYPGGSQIDKDAIGFSWLNNYWCNLLNDNAINGQHNPSKPIAITGMVVLGLTLSFFWIVFPGYSAIGKSLKLMIQISGILAMITALFLGSGINHDLVTNIASVLGLVATFGTFIGLYKNKWYVLFAFGLINILFVGMNNYLYHNKELIIYLPIIQKISFAFFLLWVCSVNMKIYRLVTSEREK